MGNFFKKITQAVVPSPIRRTVNRSETLKKAAKQLPALLGAALGTGIGGPLGGIVGGSLGGTTSRGKGNKMKGAATVAGIGLGYAALAPYLQHTFGGAAPTGMLSRFTGASGPSLLSQLGFSGAPVSGGGIGLWGNYGNKGFFDVASPYAAGASSSPFGSMNPLAKGIFGKLSGRLMGGERSYGAAQGGGDESMLGYYPSADVIPGVPLNPEQNEESNQKVLSIASDPSASALEKLLQILQMLESGQVQKGQPQQPLQINPARMGQQSIPGFKRGGYIDGHSGGQDDDVPMNLRQGSFVMDATTTSLLGDGNSKNGAKQFAKLEYDLLRPRTIRYNAGGLLNDSRPIKAKVSPGEYHFSPEAVAALGKGSNAKGAKLLDTMRKNIRKHKGVSKFLPPKSKSIEHYMGKRAH